MLLRPWYWTAGRVNGGRVSRAAAVLAARDAADRQSHPGTTGVRRFRRRDAGGEVARGRGAARRLARFPCHALVLVATVIAVLAGPAQAQTVTLVTNEDESAEVFNGNVQAQWFRTGTASEGYLLRTIDIDSFIGTGADPTDTFVTLWSVDAGEPGAKLVDLQSPASFQAGFNRFTAPSVSGVALGRDEAYFVMVNRGIVDTTARLSVRLTASPDQDGSGGWRIGNDILQRDFDSWAPLLDRVLIMRLRGRAVGVGAELSDLTVSGTDLSPDFAPETYDYAMSVANTTTRVTVTHTKFDSTATVAYEDGNGNPLDDLDGMEDGHQVDLATGENVVRLVVTSGNGNNELTYTLKLTRVAPAATRFVPADWSLKPDAVAAGDSFRLLFTTAGRLADSGDIADYNAYVQLTATSPSSGHVGIQPFGSDFRVLGSTGSVNMRVNAGTGATDADAPIYWVHESATREAVADGYADFYDGSWGNDAVRLASGGRRLDSPLEVYTGSTNTGETGFPLGSRSSVGIWGIRNDGSGSVNSADTRDLRIRPVLGLSPLFRVWDAATVPTLSDLSVSVGVLEPAFSARTLDYVVNVPAGTERITVAATPTLAGSTVVFEDDRFNELDDLDGTENGHQLALEPGENVFRLIVSATNGSAPLSYTLRVRTICAEGAVWCTDLTVGEDPAEDYAGYCDAIEHLDCVYGSVGNDYFTLYGQDYVVEGVTWDVDDDVDDNVYLTLDRDFPDGRLDSLTLWIGEDEFAVVDAGRDWDEDFRTSDYGWNKPVTTAIRALEVDETVLVQLTREPLSEDATLSGLSLTDGAGAAVGLAPGFGPNVFDYAATVAGPNARVTFMPEATEAFATVAYTDGDGTALDDADGDGNNGHQVDLVEGENVVRVVVTADDGVTRLTYTVTVQRPAAVEDATLSALALTDGGGAAVALAPVFASGVFDYAATVAGTTTRVTIAPTVTNAGATVAYADGNGTALDDADGDVNNGHQVDLVEGENVVRVVVTADDSTTTVTYTVTVERPAPLEDATLSRLSLTDGGGAPVALAPAFAPGMFDYAATVAGTATRVTIAPTATTAGATVAYTDGNDAALDDADGDPNNGHQVDLAEGANVVRVVVTADDDTTTLTYTVTVQRPAPLEDATLSGLSLTDGGGAPVALAPAFGPGFFDYAATVAGTATRITIVPTATNAGATVAYTDGNDAALDDADGDATNGHQVDLAEGENVVKVVVTADDGTTTLTYTVTVQRPAPLKDATLSALTLTDGEDATVALDPGFASGVFDYAASVPHATTRVTITPTPTNAGAAVAYTDGNGTTLDDADGLANGQQVDLAEGTNVVKVVVTATDGVATLTYTVTVERPAPLEDATLSGLSLTDGEGAAVALVPLFASGVFDYAATVAGTTTRVVIAPTATNAGATVAYTDGDGTALDDADGDPNSGHQVNLAEGANVVRVVVTAADGVTTLTYTVTVQRPASSEDATLSGVSLTDGGGAPVALAPGFGPGFFDYVATASSATMRVTLVPTATDAAATVAYTDGDGTALADADGEANNGQQVDLAEGANVVKVVVTAADGVTTLTYTVTVTRSPASEDATLSALALTDADGAAVALAPVFAAPVLDYAASVPSATARITIAPTATIAGATVAYEDGNGATLADADGEANNGQQVDLAEGTNVVEVVVTADDGITTLTYTVTVERYRAAHSGITVSSDWSLKPAAVGVGESFRLLFVSSTKRTLDSANIADYDEFLEGLAASGHADIQAFSEGFRVVGSTEAVDARDHTATTFTESERGLPIYWLNGARVANHYKDFYNGDWDDEVNPKDESGADRPDTTLAGGRPATGSDHDGTESFDGVSFALGADMVTVARLNFSLIGQDGGPLSSSVRVANTEQRPLYGLSPVLTVVSSDATLSALALTDGGGATVALDPVFASDVVAYAATVPHATTRVTITPTPTIADATVAYTDGNDAALADADGDATNGQQMDLAEGANVVKVVVTATDDATTMTYTVTVTRAAMPVNAAPVFVDGANTMREVAENTMSGQAVGTPVTATDADSGDTLTYSKTGADAAKFGLTASTGQLLTATVLDHEDPVDANEDGVYELTLSVSDGNGGTDSIDVTVTVTDVVETSVVTVTGLSDATTAENAPWTSPAPTVTGAIGDVTWSKSGADAARFTLAADGKVTLPAQSYESAVDADGGNDYEVTVKATDSDGNEGEQSITVRVTDVVETSAVTVTGLSDASTVENEPWTSPAPTVTGAIGDVTWSKSGADEARFTLAADGKVTLPAQDYESAADANGGNDYEVTVKATDEDGNEGEQSIIVRVTDVVEVSPVPAGTHFVASDWPLKPDAVAAGKSFRLLFLTNQQATSESTEIADYNAFVREEAAQGHEAIRPLGWDFSALGSTAAVNIRDNTRTGAADADAPIYWIHESAARGAVADGYADFYDGSWGNDEVRRRDGSRAVGTPRLALTGSSPQGATGDSPLGTELGAAIWRISNDGSGTVTEFATPMETNTMLGLSPLLRVSDPATDLTLSGLGVSVGALAPAFSAYTLDYAVTVPVGTGRITVNATPTLTGSTVAFEDESFNKLDDLDGMAPGHQLDLEPGQNVVRLVVSAMGGATVTYTLRIWAECRENTVWCTELTVGTLLSIEPRGYCEGTIGSGCGYGSVGDADLTLYGQDYAVKSVRWGTDVGESVHLTLDRDFPDGRLGSLTLWLGADELALDDADPPSASNYEWDGEVSASLHALAVGERVVVQLARPPPSDDATLSALALTDGGGAAVTLAPGFGPDVFDYAATVAGTTTQVTFMAAETGAYATAAYTDGGGTALADADGDPGNGHQVDLVEGGNVVKVVVTAGDGVTQQTYVVTVQRPAPMQDATLSGLAVTDGGGAAVVLMPAFASGVFDYGAAVSGTTAQITITPTATNAGATVAYQDGNGATLADADGDANGQQVDLAEGTNVVEVVVTASGGIATLTYTVTVERPPAPPSGITVPAGWSLTPAAVGAGEGFRLLFLSSTKRVLNSTNIADYDAFVQGLAANGHADIQAFSGGFRVVGSTAAVDARDHTATTFTANDKGLPIYWVAGARVANHYEDFYDQDWDDEANPKDESGANGPDTSLVGNYPATGSRHNGTEKFDGGASLALGAERVEVARPDSGLLGHGPLSSSTTAVNARRRPLYGLSPVLTVVSSDATLSALALMDGSDAAVALDPVFASDVVAYAATVPHATTRVTITPTPTIADATVAYTDGNDAALADADGDATNGQQADLAQGANVVKVVVTATDDATTMTYTVTVTRAAAVVNTPPEFGAGASTSRSVAENTVSGQNVGMPVTATDADSGDTLTYSLEGTDQASFDVEAATGQILTSAALNYEVKSSYSVTVKVVDDGGAADTIAVMVNVNDVNEQPAQPAAPTVTATANTTDSLDVSWTEPGLNGGPAITGYKLRHQTGGGAWTELTQMPTGLSHTIAGLTEGTDYAVQVKAQNGETDSDWSPSGQGTTGAVDATLSALALRDEVGGAVALDPAFDAATLAYAATVGGTAGRVTVEADAGGDGATVAFYDGAGAELEDLDDVADGHQLDLDAGENTVKVVVTEGSTEQTYTLTLTWVEEIWTALLTIGVPADSSGDNPADGYCATCDETFHGDFGALDPATFADVTVHGLWYGGGSGVGDASTLFIETSGLPGFAADRWLRIGNGRYAFVDASEGSGTSGIVWRWDLAADHSERPWPRPAASDTETVSVGVVDADVCEDNAAWFASMTVGEDTTVMDAGFCKTGGNLTCNYGRANEDVFLLDGTHFIARRLAWGTASDDTDIHLTLSAALPATRLADLTLRVGADEFPLSDATPGADNTYVWTLDAAYDSHAVGDEVIVQLLDSATPRTTLVSNTGKDLRPDESEAYQAQAFTAGADATISEILCHIATAARRRTSVKLREDDGGEPGILVATFANPATLADDALNTFTAPAGTTVDAGETYWVSVNEGIALIVDRAEYGRTSADGETGEPDWKIANTRLWRHTETENWTSSTTVLSMAIRGTVGTTVVNTAPTSADATVTTAQGTEYVFSAEDFPFEDADAADVLSSVTVVTLPAVGSLELDGVAVTAGGAVTAAQLAADDLVFTPAAGGSGSPYATFTFRVSDGTDASASAHTMTINVSAASHEVPSDWSLKPDAVAAGGKFRLLFVSSTPRNANSTDIADYNTHVQTAAAAGHADIRDYSAGFTAIGSTATVNARTNTLTRSTDTDAPIYWVDATATRTAVASGHADFYDGTWGDLSGRDEMGGSQALTSSTGPITGTKLNGTTNSDSVLGTTHADRLVTYWYVDGSALETGIVARGTSRPILGLSPVFAVADDMTVTNRAPVFGEGASTSRSVAENTASDQPVGTPVTATDADTGDTLTYSKTGADAAQFGLTASTGQLLTATVLDHEDPVDANKDGVYELTLSVSDGNGGTDSIDVTVTVTDVVETSAVTVTGLSDASTAENAPWTSPAPTVTGAIGDVTWSKSGADAARFTLAADGKVTLPAQDYESAADADGGNDYEVTVKATDSDGNEGEQSITVTVTVTDVVETSMVTVTGLSDAMTEENEPWTSPAPTVTGAIGDVTWSKSGADAARFTLAADGKVTLPAQSYESAVDADGDNEYEVTVEATDEDDNDGEQSITVAVTDVDEKPDRPAAPTVEATPNATDSLDVSWTAPGLNGGPAITGYELQHRTGSEAWTETTPSGTATSATVGGLEENTSYEVQVRALNGETDSDWSMSGTGRTSANRAPEFEEGATASREVAENTMAGQPVGAAVTATDADTGDTLTYSLKGTDANSFGIDASTGQILTSAALDRETTPSYEVTVKADDGNGGTATIAVTVSVTNVVEPPSAPDAPTVRTESATSLSVSWREPDNTGPRALTYDLQYRASGGSWTDGPQDLKDRRAVIGSLIEGTDYDVQVRAENTEGTSGWSASGSGRPRKTETPVLTVEAHGTGRGGLARFEVWRRTGAVSTRVRYARVDVDDREVGVESRGVLPPGVRREIVFLRLNSRGRASVRLLGPVAPYCGTPGAARDCTDEYEVGSPSSATVDVRASSSVPVDAYVSGGRLTLRYAEALDATSTPGPKDWVVTAATATGVRTLAVTGVSVSEADAVLALSPAAEVGEAVTLDYLPWAMHPLLDSDGVEAAPLTGLAVRNETPRRLPEAPAGAQAPPGNAVGLPDGLPDGRLSQLPPGKWLAALSAEKPATAVTRLDLRGRNLTDVSALGGLVSLETLDLSDNAVADLWPLAEMAALRRLDLSGNRIGDVSALSGLAALETLDLSGNAVSNAWPLSGLVNLRRLDLSGNPLGDVSALAGLAGLEVLVLDGGGVADVLPLALLPRLARLDLSGNALADVTLLAELRSLARLDLSGNRITAVDALGDLSHLVWLDLSGNPVVDSAPLGRLTMLRWLWLDAGPAPGRRALQRTPWRAGPPVIEPAASQAR